MCNLLKVATSPITHLITDLDLLKEQKYVGHQKLRPNNKPSQKKSKFNNVEVTNALHNSKMLK